MDLADDDMIKAVDSATAKTIQSKLNFQPAPQPFTKSRLTTSRTAVTTKIGGEREETRLECRRSLKNGRQRKLHCRKSERLS
jgi:hypothetical protein